MSSNYTANPRNLPGVLVQDYPTTHEVIVVNDNSFDDTKYILAELKKTFKKLQVIELAQEAKLIARASRVGFGLLRIF